MIKLPLSLPALLLIVSVALAGSGYAQADGKDKEGQDHPLVSRYPDSKILKHRQRAFDEYSLILGKVERKEVAKTQTLEGKITEINYEVGAGRSTLEVFRNYEAALKGAGFEILWQAKGREELGTWGDMSRFFRGMHMTDANHRYLAAHLKRPAEGDVFVALYLNDEKNVRVQLHVIEVKPMEQGLIKVDLSAEDMLKDIEKAGRVAIYGIYFETGKDEAKSESKAAIEEIGKLMKASPQLKLLVVGHTDSVGSYESNLELSMRRAASVVKAVVEGHSIAPQRLKAAGAGMMAPVVTNRTDGGRAENRRVELVEMIEK